jgi:hypothetical protein
MKRVAAVVFMLLLASFGRAQEHSASTKTTTASAASSGVRFQSVDITIDPKDKPLAAYQVEFVADASRVKLVGVEGGDHAAFREPPYYDPAALNQNRVIVAAFSTSADLPRTATRVARLHLQVDGPRQPEWSATLIVASSDSSDSIPATVGVSRGVMP